MNIGIKKAIRRAKKEARKLGAEFSLEVSDFIDDSHLNCIWYNGIIGTITVGRYTASIEVHGDISLDVLSKDYSETIASFSFRNGQRPIDNYEFTNLIPNDKKLYQLEEKDRIVWSNNNWVEYVILDESNREISSFLCEDTVLDDNVLDAFDDIAFYVNRIKEGPSCITTNK